MRADRETDADLARAFGHGHEHDVHDADAADDKRDAGDRGEQHGHRLGRSGRSLRELLLVAYSEIGFAAAAALLQQVGHILLDARHVVGEVGLDHDRVEVGPAGDALQVAGVGNDDDVVLVLAEIIKALGAEQPDDLEGQVADAQRLADGIRAGEKLVGDGLADHANLGRAAHVGLAKHVAHGDGPDADLKVVHVLALDARVPVKAVGQDLRAVLHLGADVGDAGDFVADRERILDGQRAGGAEAAAHAAGGEIAGKHADDVLAQAGDGRFHLRLGAVADADHGDDRGDADDDAERG